MTVPLRTYRLRPGTFSVTASMRGWMLYCARCDKDVATDDGETKLRRPPDMAPLMGACHTHEIAAHSATVSWREFRRGREIEQIDPEYLRSLMTEDASFGRIPMVHHHVTYEWLAEDEVSSRWPWFRPLAVTVREPESLALWIGPERLAAELAQA